MSKEVIIDGVTYVEKEEVDMSEYFIVRTYSAGAYACKLNVDPKTINRQSTVELINGRRIFFWDGALDLTQLATKGTTKPENCKLPCVFQKDYVTEVIETIPMTEVAAKQIMEIPEWAQ